MKAMPRNRRCMSALAVGLSLLLGGSALAEEPPPLTPSDFAHGRQLELARPGALQSALLDRHVYAGSVESGLADLRVFNRAGEPVPHAIRSLITPEDDAPRRVVLPLFRLEASAPAPTRAIESGPGLYEIDAEIDASGAIVRVRPAPQSVMQDASPPGAEPPAPPSGYLLDASQLERGIVALELSLAADGAEFVTRLRVEGSDDLAHFRRLTKRAAVARLAQAGHRIERTRIELPSSHDDYIRISWPKGQHPIALTAVRAELDREPAPPPRQHAEIAGRPIQDEPGAHLFDLGGALPIDRIQLALPQRNSLAEIELYSGNAEGGPWMRRHQSLVYSLEAPDASGEVLRNPPIPWPVRRHRYFKLVVSPKGGGLGAGTPLLEVAWRPEQLIFIARGEAPFTLAYGRAGAPGTRFAASNLLATTGTRPAELPPATAHAGPPMRLGSDALLEPPAEPIPMRTLALWVLLLAVVAVVAVLSLRLLGEMRSESAE